MYNKSIIIINKNITLRIRYIYKSIFEKRKVFFEMSSSFFQLISNLLDYSIYPKNVYLLISFHKIIQRK